LFEVWFCGMMYIEDTRGERRSRLVSDQFTVQNISLFTNLDHTSPRESSMYINPQHYTQNHRFYLSIFYTNHYIILLFARKF